MLSLARILGLATYPLYLLHQIVGATIYMEPSIRTLLRRFSARTTDTILGAAASQRAALSDSVTLGPEQAQPDFGTPPLLGSD